MPNQNTDKQNWNKKTDSKVQPKSQSFNKSEDTDLDEDDDTGMDMSAEEFDDNEDNIPASGKTPSTSRDSDRESTAGASKKSSDTSWQKNSSSNKK